MKKIASLVLAALFVLSLVPASVFAKTEAGEGEKLIHSNVVLDDEPAGGYTGEYVVIYNPSSDTTAAATPVRLPA